MTQVEKYKELIENIFEQTIDFSNVDIENNCIGALARINDFHIFRNNFIERLKRLREFFRHSEETTKELINTIKSIAQTKGYKWSGPYSELVALDYWIQFTSLRNIKYIDRGNVNDFEDSIAKKIGQQEIDLDISFDLIGTKVYSDVKSLIPTHTELVDQILKNLKSKVSKKDYLIGIDDVYEVDYLRTKEDYVYELQKGTLIAELAKCINAEKRSYKHKLKSGATASFRIAYKEDGGNTILSTMREMEPYKLAIDYKYKVLDYYNKLLLNQPSIITFVINPWFNQELNGMSEFNRTFFRALSRRVFIELAKNDNDMSAYFPELTGKNLKISDVSSNLTGIVFIMDNSILVENDNLYDGYVALNPNAKNKCLDRRDFDVLNWTQGVKAPFIEDFYYDNY
ncbi:MAG: hypothetical protein FWC41_08340 [Firmicutes bacterium]|nr:hypothetical protein [Bacillota bacterium]